MSFSSQFSLTLELTKLVPLALTAAGKTYESAMSLARSLQSSGSDIVVEEDLVELFGRSRITPQLESRFRREVSMARPPHQLCKGIDLYDGPGPTVNRAFAGERMYFSTVVQCSLLVNIYDKNSLAAAVAYYFQKQMEGATNDRLLRAAPGQETIRGALQACEDQTSSFNWRDVTVPIGLTLELAESKMFEPIPSAVFRGLIGMMPLVQHFPEDRLIYIETPSGVCNIVTWAHIILGLSVVVNVQSATGSKKHRFGTPSEQVVIFSPKAVVPSITLMSASTREMLLKIVEEPDEDDIDATAKTAARGYTSRAFGKLVPDESGRGNVISEMAFITTAFAICISRCLHLARPMKGREIEGDEKLIMKYGISESRIYDAATLLFDTKKLNLKKLDDYVLLYTNRSIYLQEPTPNAITVHTRDWKRNEDVWPYLCLAASQLCVLILAFAHVIDLDACSAFEMCEHYGLLARSELSADLAKWDGKSPLQIREGVWFEAIALLLVGQMGNFEFDDVCLLSNWGWSIYISTFGITDPSFTLPGFVAIKKGVPCRNGVWKHKIIDGAGTLRFGGSLSVSRAGSEVVGVSGDTVHLSCAIPVEFAPPLIGERGDSFVVSLRLNAGKDVTTRDRTGYNELAATIWNIQKTRPCLHGSRLGDDIVLDPGCIAVASIGVTADLTQYGSAIIFLTAGSAAARWRALLYIVHHSSDEVYGFTPVILRGPDCCFRCCMDQALEHASAGTWCVVL